MKSLCLLLMFIILLTGCARTDPAAAPEQGAVVQGAALPGKLLFVRQGVIWCWQGREAAPLFGDGRAAHPALSPTGDRIAYIARSNSFSDLLLADATGQPLAQLTTYGTNEPPNSLRRVYASRWVFYPTWAPDGTSLAVAAQAAPPMGDPPVDYNLGLALLPVGPGTARPLYSAEGAQVAGSAFSPDGTTLIFTRAASVPGGQQRLYRLEMASGAAQPVAGAPTPSYDPAFSPDGAWLAFTARDGDQTDIFVLPASGSGTPLRLTSTGLARAPAFAPDGRQIAFLAISPDSSGFDLWVAELHQNEGGGLSAGPPRRLTQGMKLDGDSGVVWGL
ncbi:TolB family protein [Candidatus Viridilinea mediisalina]|uniref:Uncharacterized protein n=1 Tax=Candidatus Viridilinea mediisalina TaxID=2024553 RepID=A0A2A6RFD1_9CHLR|nr:PD40 domain-containing protein [Candidatus Viridilinea mediisalina]PDW01787.1 hypothetical protein CJ255_17360 [Candidatus Viridilinea mediisalina]